MNRNAGFTLIELIVTVALAAIILTIGVPSFREAIQNNRRTTQVNEMISALNIARSEAIKRGVQVTMCKSTDGTNCNTTACNASTGDNCWEKGWIIFADANSNGSPDAGETVNVHGALSQGVTLRVGSDFTNSVTYSSNGTVSGNISGGDNSTFSLCDSRGVDQARFTVINKSGRPTVREHGSSNSGDSCP